MKRKRSSGFRPIFTVVFKCEITNQPATLFSFHDPIIYYTAMIECVDVCLGDPMIELCSKPPIWKIWKGVDYKKFDASSERMFQITSGIIKKAQIKNKVITIKKFNIMNRQGTS